MRPFFFILAILTAAILASADASAKPKAQGLTIRVCASVDVYSGAIDANHPATRIAEACRDMTVKAARKAIDACQVQGPEACEVLHSADRKTILLETKILVSDTPIGGAT